MTDELHKAAEEGNVEKIRELIDSGVNVDVLDSVEGLPATAFATRLGQLGALKCLVDEYASDIFLSITYGNEANFEITFFSTCSGSIEIAQYLYDKGVSFNVISKDGLTTMHGAAMHDRPKMMKWLHDRIGLSYESLTSQGVTPLAYAISCSAPAAVSFLLNECNAQYNVIDDYGNSPLYQIVNMRFMERRIEVLKVINDYFKKNVIFWDDVIVNFNTGLRLLHLAVLQKDMEVIRFLVEEGDASISKSFAFPNGDVLESPVALASKELNDDTEILVFFYEHDNECFESKLETGVECFVTPVHHAAGHGRFKVLELFKSDGVNLNLCGIDGVTPEVIALMYNRVNVLEWFRDNGELSKDPLAFYPALNPREYKNSEAIKYLIKICGFPAFCEQKELFLYDDGAEDYKQEMEFLKSIFDFGKTMVLFLIAPELSRFSLLPFELQLSIAQQELSSKFPEFPLDSKEDLDFINILAEKSAYNIVVDDHNHVPTEDEKANIIDCLKRLEAEAYLKGVTREELKTIKGLTFERERHSITNIETFQELYKAFRDYNEIAGSHEAYVNSGSLVVMACDKKNGYKVILEAMGNKLIELLEKDHSLLTSDAEGISEIKDELERSKPFFDHNWPLERLEDLVSEIQEISQNVIPNQP